MEFFLAAIAFALFGISAHSQHSFAWVLLAQSVYGVSESLRTGAHKAIALDWLRTHQLHHRTIDVLSRMRFFSKTSAGITALSAGIIVWQSGAIAPLFWCAIPPTLMAIALIDRYPENTEGTLAKRRRRPRSPSDSTIGSSLRDGNVWRVLIPSILFESQVKLALAYLQPAVAQGGRDLDLSLLGGAGALLVGTYLALSGLLAGGSAFLSQRLVSLWDGPKTAVYRIHAIAALTVTIACLGLFLGLAWPGLVLLLGLAALQNARRPIFLAHLDDLMDPNYRTTVLSAESQCRNWLYAGTAVLAGWLADHTGLHGVFILAAALLWLATCLASHEAGR